MRRTGIIYSNPARFLSFRLKILKPKGNPSGNQKKKGLGGWLRFITTASRFSRRNVGRASAPTEVGVGMRRNEGLPRNFGDFPPETSGGTPSALRWGGFILKSIGKPFYWAILWVFALFIFISWLMGKTVFFLLKSAIRFLIWFPIFFLKLAKVVGFILFSLFQTLLSLRIKLPRLKVRLPKIKIILPRPRFELRLPRRRIRFLPIRFRLPRPKIAPKLLLISLSLLLILYTIYYFLFTFFYGLPNPDELINRQQIVSTKIYDRNGELLYKIYRRQNRTLVRLEDIPLHLIQATIAIEDAEFYQHHGFSPKAIARALIQNLKGEKLYGASTITQQLVKNALLGPERTIKRKTKELILAIGVESKLSKDQILQMYLNEVGYGGAAYGAEEAAQMYFGKSVKEIDLAEATLLAGLPASPTSFSPFGAHPEKTKERQALVLKRMVQEGFVTPEQADQAKSQELHFVPQRTDIKAPHFVMYVKELLAAEYGEQMVEEGGLEVKTSLDLGIQEITQEIVSQEIKGLLSLRITNGAVLVTKPQTGEILAMVGSKDYFNLEEGGNVNVTLRPRQPGSAIKPVNYALALQNGFTAATIIPDTPITYQAPGQPPYSPKNYDNRFHGHIPLRVALASSYNVPAVKVLSALGVENMIQMGENMGITTWEDRFRFGLSLTLGGGEVKMVDMAVSYGVLANMGKRADLNPILEVRDYKGKVLEKFEPPEMLPEIIDPRIAFILTDILSDNAARTPAFGPRSWLNVPNHPHVAVKTGTTQNLRDNWTIGYTQNYLVAVWVGNNDNRPMSYVASGVTGASPIWHKTMNYLLKDLPDKEFPQPEGLTKVQICPLTGTLPCQGCGGKWEYFLPGSEPKFHCSPESIKEILEKKEEG